MKAYQNDWRYNILKKWCDATVRSLFGTVSSDGKEDLPTDGAVILAPNHCNTLMDALVVLQDSRSRRSSAPGLTFSANPCSTSSCASCASFPSHA